MDIYEFAKQMEKDGETYYRELADSSELAGLKRIFTILAEEEVKHYQIIEQLRLKSGLPQMADTRLLENVKNIFVEMKEVDVGPRIDTTRETNAYRKARELEKMSQEFYLEKAAEVEGKEAKRLLEKLAAEEERHFRIMENIVEFVSRPEPGNWLENAEWHHLDEDTY